MLLKRIVLTLCLACCLSLPACGVFYDETYRLPGKGAVENYTAGYSDYQSVQTLADSASMMAYEAYQSSAQAAAADSPDAAARAADAAAAAAASAAEAARAAQSMKSVATMPPPPPEPHNFLGLRFDKTARVGRPPCPTEEPCLVPSISEMRKAKADAKATAELKALSGDTQIKPDGSSSNPNEVKFAAAPGALNINLIASDNLNAFDGIPHALVLNIYHLEDRTFFDQLASNSEGIRKLLSREAVDPSIKAVRQLFVQPGTHSVMSIERSENGRYVAFVAGFDRTDPTTSIHVSSYGIGHYKQKKGMLAKSQDMFSPLPLNLIVSLDMNSMTISETDEIFDNVGAARQLSGPPPAPVGASSSVQTYDSSRYYQPPAAEYCPPAPVVSTPICATCP